MAVITAGFAMAVETAHPPGEFTLEAVMFGIGVDNCAITLNTVPVADQHNIVLPSGFYALTNGTDRIAVWVNKIRPIDTGQSAEYYLRL